MRQTKYSCMTQSKSIFDAVRENNYSQAQSMLPFYRSSYNFGYKEYDKQGKTLLHLAAENGDVHMMRILFPSLQHLVNDVSKIEPWNTFMSVDSMARISGNPYLGETPLQTAFRCHHLEVGFWLASHGANVDVKHRTGKTLLHCALEQHQTNLIKFLVQCNASIYVKDNAGRSVLEYAIDYGLVHHLFPQANHDNISRLLDSESLLHRAAQTNDLELVKKLLVLGADVCVQDNTKMIPLEYAIRNGSLSMIQELLKNPSTRNLQLSWQDVSGKTAIEQAVLSSQFSIADYLLSLYGHIDVTNENALTLLHKAVYYENKDAVLYCLKAHAQVNAKDEDQRTPLYLAAHKGCGEICTILLDHGADVCIRTLAPAYKNFLPLHVAIVDGHAFCAERILRHKSIQSISNEDLQKALVLAVECGLTGIVDLLLKFNIYPANEFKAVMSECELIDKAIEGNQASIAFMLMNRCNVAVIEKIKSENKNRAFAEAVMTNQLDIAKLLLEHGADVNTENAKGFQLLHDAIQNNKPKVVQFLFEHGADINKIDREGNTPLHIAIWKWSSESVNELLNHGADQLIEVPAIWSLGGRELPLHSALRYGQFDIALSLMKHPTIKMMSKVDLGKAMALAIRNNSQHIIDMILDLGLYTKKDLTEFALYGDPIDFAISSDNDSLVKKFLERGFTCSNNAFVNAVKRGNKSLVKMLVLYGADCTCRDSNGKLPHEYTVDSSIQDYLVNTAPFMQQLFVAARKGDKDLLELCIAHNADINIRDKHGNTPLTYAVMEGKCEIVQKLLEYGADPSIANHNHLNPVQLSVQYNKINILQLFTHAALPQYLVNRKATMDHVESFLNRLYELEQRWKMLHATEKRLDNYASKSFYLMTGFVGVLCSLLPIKYVFHSIRNGNFNPWVLRTRTVAACVLGGLIYHPIKKAICSYFAQRITRNEKSALEHDCATAFFSINNFLMQNRTRSNAEWAYKRIDAILCGTAQDREPLTTTAEARYQLAQCKEFIAWIKRNL